MDYENTAKKRSFKRVGGKDNVINLVHLYDKTFVSH